MKYEFELIVEGPDLQDDDHFDALYEAGLDDATIARSNGVQLVILNREAPKLFDAVVSAIRQVESAVAGARVARVAPDSLVALVDIAERVQRSVESVRLLAEGKRGPGSFPQPAALVGGRRLWRWMTVAAWFNRYSATTVTKADVNDAIVLDAVNEVLADRARGPLEEDEQRELEALALA